VVPAALLFHALGDPVRLGLLERLAARQPCILTELTRDFPMTRQGARKHLQVLVDAGLVSLEERGRACLARLRSDPLAEARAYLARLERRWEGRLDALRKSVEGRTPPPTRRGGIRA
jgi:DNA-binding transcriptional ArsR family regulator